jgi:lipopolysaccharide export system protein LptA
VNRARRITRRFIAGAGLGLLSVLAYFYRKPGMPTGQIRDAVAETLVKEAKGIRDRVRFRGFDYVETRAQQGKYHLRATEALGFEENGDQIIRLKDVLFESREGSSSAGIAITAPRAEFAQVSRAIRVFDGVRIEGEGTTLNGKSFHYENLTGKFRSDGPVTAMRGGLVARADEGELQARDGVLALKGAVRVRGRMEGARRMDLSAPAVRLGRLGELAAEGGVTIKTEESFLRSRTFTRTAELTGDRLRAEGAAQILLHPDPSRISGPLFASAQVIELSRDEAGEPARLELSSDAGRSRIDVAPDGKNGARRALAPRFEARFLEGHLAELNVAADLDASESVPPDAAPGSGLRRLTAGFARFTFQPDGRSLNVGTLEKGVVLSDGTRAVLKAPRGTLRGMDDTAVFAGDPGNPASYQDEKGSLKAQTLAYARRDGRVDAAGTVLADFRSGEHLDIFGTRSGDPIHSRSDTLQMGISDRKLTLTGGVQAWQKENVLRCRKLFLDDQARSLRAEGDVRAFLRRRLAAPAGAKGSPASETINVSGDLLTHREADRLVRIEGQATVVSGTWNLKSDITDIRLGADQSIEFAEARGAVTIEDRIIHRRGAGAKATWRPQMDVVTLEGKPATVVDEKGNRLTGAVLTIRKGHSRVDVAPGEGIPSEGVFRPEGS